MADSAPDSPEIDPVALSDPLRRNIEALAERRRREDAEISVQERAVHAVTRFLGSMKSFYLHLVVYALWVLANLGAFPHTAGFDPSFGILGTEASVEAIFLATFVLISQNRAAEAEAKRSALDLHIGLLTEHELTKVARLLAAVATRMGIEHGDALDEVKKDIAPEAVLNELETSSELQDGRP